MALHKDMTGANNHVTHSWSPADAAARTAISVVAADVGKIALQLDTQIPYMLVDDSPVVWQSLVNAGGSSTPSGFNPIINSTCLISQRGTSFAAVGPTLDMWRTIALGTGATGFAVAQTDAITLAGLSYPFKKLLTWDRTAGTTLSTIDNRIEDARTFAGKTVTLSFDAYCATGTVAMGCRLDQYFGSGGAPSATVASTQESVTLTTTPQRFTKTFALASVAAKTFGTADDSSLQIVFDSPAAGAFGIRMTGLRLDEGSVAGVCGYIDPATELAKCKRYQPSISGAGPISTAWCSSTTTAFAEILYVVTPRVKPTGISVIASSHYGVFNSAGAYVTASSVVFNDASLTSGRVLVTVASGLVAGAATGFRSDTAGSLLLFTGCTL